MVPPGTKGAYTLELAIISITPTNARAGIFVTALSGIKGGGLVKAVHQERAHCHGGTPEG